MDALSLAAMTAEQLALAANVTALLAPSLAGANCSELSHALALTNTSVAELALFFGARAAAAALAAAPGDDAEGAQAAADECAAAGANAQSYTPSRHVTAIFCVLAASFAGSAVPLMGKLHERLRIPPLGLALLKAAGAGIILSAALVHLLSPGVASLTNPCLPPFFTETYPALSYAVATGAALLMMGIEHMASDFLSRSTCT
jgi:hypothetical protein